MSKLATIKVPQDRIKGVPEEDLTTREKFRIEIYEYKIKRG